MNSSTGDAATTPRSGAVVETFALDTPRRIGAYATTGVLGTGGMGVVYRAGQQEPLRREVALKPIGRGLDTDRLISRFEAERLALARMSHSGIAVLGVVLYELLAGRIPHRFTQGTRDELREKLRDVPPVRPSTAIGGPRAGRFTAAPAPEAWAAIAGARRTTSDRLRRAGRSVETQTYLARARSRTASQSSSNSLSKDLERLTARLEAR